jgi:hypothetical protein
MRDSTPFLDRIDVRVHSTASTCSSADALECVLADEAFFVRISRLYEDGDRRSGG